MVKKNENISANLEVCDFCIHTHTHTITHYHIILFAATASGARHDIRGGNFFLRKLLFQGSFPPFFVSILCLNPKNKINKI